MEAERRSVAAVSRERSPCVDVHKFTSKELKRRFDLTAVLENCQRFSLKHRLSAFRQDVEIKAEGPKHLLILYNVRMDMVGAVEFSAGNAQSNAQLRVKGESARQTRRAGGRRVI